MLIKGVDKSGKAIPIAPAEAIPHAVQYGVKTQNTSENIFWVDPKSVEVTAFHHTPVDEQGNWVAHAHGEAMIGKTTVANDRFHLPKKYSFKMRFSSSKDAFGIPDIKVDDFAIEVMETNPSKLIGEVDTSQEKAPLAVGELTASSAQGGRPSKKVVK